MKKSSNHTIWISAAVAAALVGMLLSPYGGMKESYDLARMHECYKFDFRAAVLAGEMPWWNPYTALGRPFLADVETATLYPLSWLIIPFGVSTGIILIIWSHLGLAIEGMRRLGEQLKLDRTFAMIAAIAFVFSGSFLGRIQSGQLGVFSVICLWPWVWWAGARLQDEPGVKSIARMALWLALSFLAGSPQLVWCGLLPLGVFLLTRSVSLRESGFLLIRLAASGTLSLALVAVQLIPFVELVQQGNRPLDDISFATRFGVSGVDWITLVFPPGRGWMQSGGEFNLYVGAPFFVLSCAAVRWISRDRNVRALTAAGIFALVLAAGDKTPVLPFLAESIPGFAGLRYPSRYALASVLVIMILASGWLNQVYRNKRISPRIVCCLVGLQGAALLAGFVIQANFYRTPPPPLYESQLISDLKSEGLPRDGAPPRVALNSFLLLADAGLRCGVSTLHGFNNPALDRTWTTLYLMANQPRPRFHRAEVPPDIVASMSAHKRYFGLSVTFIQSDEAIHFATPPLPRTFVSFSVQHIPDWRDAVTLIRDGHDFANVTLVEQIIPLPQKTASTPASHTDIVAFNRNRIVVDYRSTSPGILVLAEAWYPGWTAQIGTKPNTPVLPVNGWMRGIMVPAGENQVIFEYQPTWWWLSVLLTLFGGLVTIVFWVLPTRSRTTSS